ncbi:P-loop containing nucleoside triphosphate hydrolase protein [Aspergillus alliaceus]|uniref:P-loop containing nucleoside triphosphate hydrolase protein n=1 Tax=Petromyces alliaceus TaxID=209559 RepID=UPI0012A60613|nr:P-loop containing nucleoside triphosphate hydrolase protein [Aspergillus alliaceus]KAB8235657.1 P-loop containing nucleoside triphosphate hydrolase protein [Aspergillus alliaceus]
MTVNPEILSITTGVLGLLLIALNTAPATLNVVHRLSSRSQPIRLETLLLSEPGYQDEDGEATESSLLEFSDSWQRVAIAILSVVGLELSLASAIVCLQTGQSYFIIPFWLLLGSWALLCLQSVAFFTESSTVERYRLSIYSFWASSLTVAVPCIEVSLLWSAGYNVNPGHVQTVLVISQLIAASLRSLCSILIPRRPNVYHDGQVVDQELTYSVYSRFTFSWVNGLMKYAAENRSLEIDSLPKLPFAIRSENLYRCLEETRQSRKLWKALFLGHIRPLIWQAALSLVTCVLSFGPQVALYGILKSLEERSAGSGGNLHSWLWVAALGVVIVVSYSIESWLWWIISSQLWVPIYEGLSAIVFAKSMRCKDVKNMKSTTQDSTPDEEETREEKSRQSIMNLAAVDSKRVADFATFNYLIPSCIMRLLLAIAFLAHLLGWRSLLAGLSVSAVITPLNTFVTRRYSAAQQEFMKASDQRTSAVTEVLQGIRQIKISALEQQWQDRITEKRRVELGLLWKTSLYTTGLVSVWILGPLMLSAVSLTVYALNYGNLPASVAFTALSVFGNLESSLAGLPDLISKGMEAKVSSDRIDKYLASAEKAPYTSDVDSISFDSATIAWPSAEEESRKLPDMGDRFVLRNLNVQFPSKGLSVIAGKTGSGKSLLLAAILGECDVIQGSIAVPHSPSLEERQDDRAMRDNWIIDTALAYVAQNPWIENATIRDNIRFGLPYNWRRYRKVLMASGLEKDLTILPDGDMTDVGANGINLSGGQRWRISFARALYSRAGILVMDDIFSALDAETGRHVYEQGLTGSLAENRTRILVTHHVGLCFPRTDYCVLLENGYMTHAGPVDQLRAAQGLTDFLQDLNAEMRGLQDREVARDASRKKRSSVGPPPAPTDSHAPKQFTQDEYRATGSIPMKVYTAYMTKDNSWLAWTLTFLTYAGFMALLVGRSWWVSAWTSSKPTSGTVNSGTTWDYTVQRFKEVRVDNDLMFYLGVYLALSAAACVIGTLRQLAISYASLKSSRQLFDDLLAVVLRAPMRWLDTVPLGRILNRFTSDVYTIDWRLAFDLGHFVYKVLELAGIMVAGFLVSPVLLVFACLLLVFCVYLSNSYLAGARELKRLESNSKSPVMEQFDSSLAGLTTIRAFNKVEVYVRQMYSKIDRHAQTVWNSWLFNRWLAFRMSIVGAIFSTGAAALVVYVPTIPAALAGFAISFALQYNYAVSMGLRFYAEMEMDMNSTERVLEYSDLDTEDQGGYEPPAAWPLRGRVEVDNLVVAYAPDLPPVLNGLSFNMEPNQRVGVVGRTGAGKSSLTLALFRFLEARKGHIVIDGLDVSKMTLQALRSRLAIIPQDPVLFSGTVRSNLDPFHEYTDTELYNALERVHLLSFEDAITLASQSQHDSFSGSDTLASTPISPTTGYSKPSSFFTSLSAPISEGGLNISQGQRQLLCLARAIVAQPKIMILDEATSAVDMETDALIQRSIRSEFGRHDSSLLVIAHRLSTIADFDRILVMDAGKAVEFGPPLELLGIEGGVFRNLVENSGERAVLEEMILGKRN